MAEEANVKVRLDTKTAKSELRGLSKLASAGVGGIAGGIAGGLLARGRGIATAPLRQAGAAVSSSALGIVSGPLNQFLASFKSAILGGLDMKAQANKMAFEQLPFDLIGKLGKIPPGVVELHKHKKALILEGLEGRRLAERDSNLNVTKDIQDKVIKTVAEVAVGSGFAAIAARIYRAIVGPQQKGNRR